MRRDSGTVRALGAAVAASAALLWLAAAAAADEVKVRGYWGPFHRTQTWHRLKEEPQLD